MATQVHLRELNDLVKLQAILERARVSTNNQSLHIQDHPDSVAKAVMAEVFSTLDGLEGRIEKVMHSEVQYHPAWPWLNSVRGIGPQTASLMLAYLLPPLPDKGPSSWFKAAGLYAIEQPSGEMRMPRYSNIEGRATWHPRLRRNLFVVGQCLIRANGYYKGHYDSYKATLQAHHPDWKGRCHAVAQWQMVKLFLAHLWSAWCEAAGIHDRGPYGMTTLVDGTQVLRYVNADGSYQDRAYVPYPRNGG